MGVASVGYNADDGSTPTYGSYSMIMANAFDTSTINATKSAGKIPVVYQDLTSTRSDDGGGALIPTGMSFAWTRTNHPDWFLTKDGSVATSSTPVSNLVPENGFPTQYMMDWSNVGYQNTWAQQVIARMNSLGVHWVFADNSLTTATAYTNSPLPKFPTNASVQTATLAAMKNITAQLNAAGIKIIYNVGYTSMFDASPASSLWNNWLPYSNGLTNEFPQYQGYSGDVANQKQTCLSAGKVCWFGRNNGLAPEFDIVGNPATVTSG